LDIAAPYILFIFSGSFPMTIFFSEIYKENCRVGLSRSATLSWRCT